MPGIPVREAGGQINCCKYSVAMTTISQTAWESGVLYMSVKIVINWPPRKQPYALRTLPRKIRDS